MLDLETATADAAGLDGYVVEDQVGFMLRRANQRHVALFADAMSEADLTPPQFAALVKIAELGQVTQNLLGRLVAMDPATIQGVTRRLIARGLVSREADAHDRRAAVLRTTAAGRFLARSLTPRAERISEATLAPLDIGERATFLSLLRKLG